MITNIVASIIVTLVTNVMSSDNAVYEPDYSVLYATYPGTFGTKLKTPATESYQTTNITEVTVLRYEWQGSSHDSEVSRKLLSSVTAIMRKNEEWKPAGLRTNDVSSQMMGSIYVTNIFVP